MISLAIFQNITSNFFKQFQLQNETFSRDFQTLWISCLFSLSIWSMRWNLFSQRGVICICILTSHYGKPLLFVQKIKRKNSYKSGNTFRPQLFKTLKNLESQSVKQNLNWILTFYNFWKIEFFGPKIKALPQCVSTRRVH